MQVSMNYDLCLWKHSESVTQSPTGVVYSCEHCEKPTTTTESYKELRKRRKSRKIQTSKARKRVNS